MAGHGAAGSVSLEFVLKNEQQDRRGYGPLPGRRAAALARAGNPPAVRASLDNVTGPVPQKNGRLCRHGRALRGRDRGAGADRPHEPLFVYSPDLALAGVPVVEEKDDEVRRANARSTSRMSSPGLITRSVANSLITVSAQVAFRRTQDLPAARADLERAAAPSLRGRSSGTRQRAGRGCADQPRRGPAGAR